MIHSTAIVDSSAELAPGVSIGPFAIVEAGVTIGNDCIIEPHAVLCEGTTLGRQNRIGHHSVIGSEPQDLSFKPKIRSGTVLGERNVIREFVSIHRGTADGTVTHLGDDNYVMNNCHIGHNSDVGNNVILANGSMLGGYVSVQDGAFLGGATGVHQYVRVGRLAMTQGKAMCSQDIPPFLIAAGLNEVYGLNVVGLRRAGFTAAERAEIKRAFKLLYMSGLNTRQALARAAETEWLPVGKEFFDFVAAASKRGISSYKRTTTPDETA